MSRLKDYFIPHEENGHKPHFLRNKNAAMVLAVVLLIEAIFLTQIFIFQRTNLFASILQNVLVSETNDGRQSEHLPTLRENPLLNVAAKMKAEDMAAKGYFAHTSPGGVEPWHWLGEVGYDYLYAGENLAVNFADSEDVVRAWMDSPTHLENIMDKRFTEIGIATARGMYKGNETVFIVQLFGTPMRSIAMGPAQLAAGAVGANEEAVQAEGSGEGDTSVLSAVTPEPGPVSPWHTEADETPAAAQGPSEESSSGEEVALGSAAPEPWSGKLAPSSEALYKVFTSPKVISYYFLMALMIVVAIALSLNVAIKPKVQHPRLIANGIVLLLLINVTLIFNSYLPSIQGTVF